MTCYHSMMHHFVFFEGRRCYDSVLRGHSGFQFKALHLLSKRTVHEVELIGHSHYGTTPCLNYRCGSVSTISNWYICLCTIPWSINDCCDLLFLCHFNVAGTERYTCLAWKTHGERGKKITCQAHRMIPGCFIVLSLLERMSNWRYPSNATPKAFPGCGIFIWYKTNVNLPWLFVT